MLEDANVGDKLLVSMRYGQAGNEEVFGFKRMEVVGREGRVLVHRMFWNLQQARQASQT